MFNKSYASVKNPIPDVYHIFICVKVSLRESIDLNGDSGLFMVLHVEDRLKNILYIVKVVDRAIYSYI